MIINETENEENVFSSLKNAIQTKNKESLKELFAGKYAKFNDKLSLKNEEIFYDGKLMVPAPENRKEITREGHSSHMGIGKTIRKIRMLYC